MPVLTQLDPAATRNRYLAFAFAAADLLIEISPGGTILFAMGAFEAHFGSSAPEYVGRPLTSLLQPADHAAVDTALSLLSASGRMRPMVVHLRNTARAAVALSGIVMPGSRPRLCLTIGPVALNTPAPTPSAATKRTLEAEAALRLRGEGGRMGLLQVDGWKGRRRAGGPDTAEVLETLTALGGPGCVAASIADGRFGVVGSALDGAALAARLSGLLRSGTDDAPAVHATDIDLAAEAAGLPHDRAVRALRFALMCFTDQGRQGLDEAGFSDGLAGFARTAERRTEGMRASIRAGRFDMMYQPVVRLQDRGIHHYEALLRPLVNDSQPLRHAGAFVAFAEAVGLNEELDNAVLARTIRDSHAAGRRPVAANLSGLSLQSEPFCDAMEVTLARHPHMLVELTETAAVADAPGVARSMQRLRSHGIRVCLDDFGAGAASFHYLRDFQVDLVKIDGAYVRAATEGERDRGLLAGMVELAHAAKAEVVAEMVESEASAALVKELGIKLGQGWLFGRPGYLPGLGRVMSA